MSKRDPWKVLATHYNFPARFFKDHVKNALFDDGLDDEDGFLSLWVQSLPMLDKNRPKSVKLAFRYDCAAMITRYRDGKFHFKPVEFSEKVHKRQEPIAHTNREIINLFIYY